MCKEASGLGTHFLKTLKYKKRVRFFFLSRQEKRNKKKEAAQEI
jgi:hypothetical protein